MTLVTFDSAVALGAAGVAGGAGCAGGAARGTVTGTAVSTGAGGVAGSGVLQPSNDNKPDARPVATKTRIDGMESSDGSGIEWM